MTARILYNDEQSLIQALRTYTNAARTASLLPARAAMPLRNSAISSNDEEFNVSVQRATTTTMKEDIRATTLKGRSTQSRNRIERDDEYDTPWLRDD